VVRRARSHPNKPKENGDDPLGHKLTRSVVFQELLKIAVQGSDCLIEEARIGEKSWRFDYFNIK
jgi:hypothetical protein